MQNQNVAYFKADPFSERVHRQAYPPGLNVREIAAIFCAHLDHCKVRIDDALIEDFDAVPLPGQVVIITEFPQDPATIFAIIAYVASAAGASAAVANTIAVYGTLAVLAAEASLLGLTPKAPKIDAGGGGTGKRASLYTGANNELILRQPIPIVLGTYQITPPFAVRPYTEPHALTQRLHSAFIIGMGDYDVSNFKIGKTPVSEFSTVLTETKKLTAGDFTMRYYPGTQIETFINVQLRDQWPGSTGISTSTQRTDSLNAVRLKATFLGRGLGYYGHNGKFLSWDFRLTCEYRAVGDVSWTTFYDKVLNKRILDDYFVVAETGVPNVTVTGTLPAAQYDIRSTIIPQGRQNNFPKDRGGGGALGQITVLSDLTWISIDGFENGNPITLPNITVVSLQADLVEQPNGSLDQFNCTVSSKVPILNSDGTAGAISATANPARLCYWLLTGAMNSRPVDTDRIDGVAFYNWQQYCEQNALRFDGVLDYGGSRREDFDTVAETGFGSFTYRDGLISVIVDGLDLTTPRQLFSPRNILADSVSIGRYYATTKHGIHAQFPNQDKGYKVDDIYVYNTGYSSSNATDLEEFSSLSGLTTASGIHKFIKYKLLRERLRPEIYSFSAPLDAVVCQRGDVVNFQHDSTLVGLRSARAVTVSSGTNGKIASCTIDEPFTLASGTAYEVTVRSSANAFTVAPIRNDAPFGSSVNDTALTFTPALPSGTFTTGDLLSFGPVGASTIPLLITEIEPSSDLTFKITATNAAPSIFTALVSGTMPAFTSSVTTTQGTKNLPPPVPTIISVDKKFISMGADEESDPRIRVDIPVRPSASGNFAQTARYHAMYKVDSPLDDLSEWQQVPDVPVSAGTISFELETANTFDVRVWAVSPFGVISDTYASSEDEPVLGGCVAPTNVLAEAAFDYSSIPPRPVVDVTWNGPYDASAAGYVVRYNKDDGPYTTVQTVGSQPFYSIKSATAATYKLEVYSLSLDREISSAATGTFDISFAAPNAPLRPTGFQVDGQGNSTVFIGKHVKLKWTANSPHLDDPLSDSTSLGSTADAGAQDPFFQNYQLLVYASGTLVRTEDKLTDTNYIYTYEKNVQDGGPRRDLSFELRTRDVNNNLSDAAVLTVSNPPPSALTGIVSKNGLDVIQVACNPVDTSVTDLDQYLLWADTTSGFTPSESTKVCASKSPFLLFSTVTGTTFYMRTAASDTFTSDPNLLNLSSEFSETTGVVQNLGYFGTIQAQSGQFATSLTVSGIPVPTVAAGCVLLDHKAVSNATSIDFTSDVIATGTYQAFQFIGRLKPSLDDQDIMYAPSFDGRTFTNPSNSIKYRNTLQTDTTDTPGTQGATDIFFKTSNVTVGAAWGNADGEGGAVDFRVIDIGGSDRGPKVRWDGSYLDSNGAVWTFQGGGYSTTRSGICGLRILAESGNISGEVFAYGMRRS